MPDAYIDEFGCYVDEWGHHVEDIVCGKTTDHDEIDDLMDKTTSHLPISY